MLATELNEDHLRSVQPEDFRTDGTGLSSSRSAKSLKGRRRRAEPGGIDRLRRQGALQTAGGAEYIEQIVAAQMIPKASIQDRGRSSRAGVLRHHPGGARHHPGGTREGGRGYDKLDAAEQRIMKIRDCRDSGQGMIDMVDVMKDITSKMTEGPEPSAAW